MVEYSKEFPSALKHGIFSKLAVFPGEDPAEFEKLRDELIAYYALTGPIELAAAETMARLILCNRRLWIFVRVPQAKKRYEAIRRECGLTEPNAGSVFAEAYLSATGDREDIEAERAARRASREQAEKTADDRARAELGDDYALLSMSDDLTIECLDKVLSLVQRVNTELNRCQKGIVLGRGMKSLSVGASAATPPQQLTGPSLGTSTTPPSEQTPPLQ